MKMIWLCMLIALLGGCALNKPVERTSTFNETEYAPYAGTGTSSITGQAFAKTVGGDVKFAAGNSISLNPVTVYSTEFYNTLVIQQKAITAPDTRAAQYNRTTIADGNGNFEFHKLPAGEYYVTTILTWSAPGMNGPVPTGAALGAKVSVGPGETAKVIVTR